MQKVGKMTIDEIKLELIQKLQKELKSIIQNKPRGQSKWTRRPDHILTACSEAVLICKDRFSELNAMSKFNTRHSEYEIIKKEERK